MFSKILYLSIFFLFNNIHSECKDLNDSSQVTFNYDFCRFKYSEDKTLVEFYYAISFNQIETAYLNNHFVYLNLKFNDKETATSVLNEVFKLSIPADIGHGKSMIGQINFILNAGEYLLSLEANDSLNFIYKDTLTVYIPSHPVSELYISDIQLASDLKVSQETQSIFYKNGYDITPNTEKLFGKNINNVFYYCEIYNMKSAVKCDTLYMLLSINDNSGNELISRLKKIVPTINNRIETGRFDISTFPSGKYQLSAKIFCREERDWIAQSSDYIYIYNPDVITSLDIITLDYEMSDISKLLEEKLSEEISQTKYIMSEQVYKNITQTNNFESRKVLYYNFWAGLSSIYSKPIKELRKNYFDKVEFASRNFKNDNVPGWMTDRGRIYCLYGKPDEVEARAFEQNVKPYEIWRYFYIEGGVEFVFVDLSGDGRNYQLVHSTMKNEIRNDDWKRKYSQVR